MRKFFGLLLSGLVGLLIASPATAVIIYTPLPPPRVLVGSYQNIHNVAVLSAIGGSMTFQNHYFVAPVTGSRDISEWKIDELVDAMLRQYLGSRFNVRAVPFDRAALAAIPNGPWNASGGPTRRFLQSLPNEGLDAFVVVRPDLELEAPGLIGIALTRNMIVGNPTPILWANYEIDVIDAHSYETIALAHSRLVLHRGEKLSYAGLYTDDSLKLDDTFALDAKQKDTLHGLVFRLVTASMIETLRALELNVPLPEPGARELIPAPPNVKPYPDISSVAIVSGIGDAIDFERMATVFVHWNKTLAVPDWQLDALVEKEARELLDKRFTVRDVPIDHAAFARASLLDDDGNLKPTFPGLSPSPNVDAYVAFVKVRTNIAGKMQGIGLGVLSNPFYETATNVFASYAVAVIDAHTLKLISARLAVPSPEYPSPKPMKAIDDRIWPDNPLNPSNQQREAIEREVRALLMDTAGETMMRLGLTGKVVEFVAVPNPQLQNPANPTSQGDAK